jgi:hypothetical protein
MIGRVGRFAGSLLKGVPREEMFVRLGTDALGGLMAAAYTPGDLGDKLIAGGAATIGGAAGGLALGKLGGKNQLAAVGLDMAGSIGGDMLLSRMGEEVMKGKSYMQGEGYMSPYEKLGAEQQQALAAAIQKDVLRQYGLMVPGAPTQYADPTTGMGVS